MKMKKKVDQRERIRRMKEGRMVGKKTRKMEKVEIRKDKK